MQRLGTRWPPIPSDIGEFLSDFVSDFGERRPSSIEFGRCCPTLLNFLSNWLGQFYQEFDLGRRPNLICKFIRNRTNWTGLDQLWADVDQRPSSGPHFVGPTCRPNVGRAGPTLAELGQFSEFHPKRPVPAKSGPCSTKHGALCTLFACLLEGCRWRGLSPAVLVVLIGDWSRAFLGTSWPVAVGTCPRTGSDLHSRAAERRRSFGAELSVVARRMARNPLIWAIWAGSVRRI